MNSYILLRNNKETGPFSLEALQQMGLKSTDLIWVECQSMNWRHPNEITELKALLADDSNPVPGNSKQQLPPDDSKMVEVTADTLIDKKLVFAELPTVTKPVNEKKKSFVQDSALTDIQKYGGIADFETPKNEIASSETHLKYSRPLDEIKEMYVKNLEQKMRSKKGISFQLLKKYRQPVIYVCLLLTGAGVALFFRNTGNKNEIVLPQTIQQSIPSPSSEPIQDEPTEVAAILPIKTEEQQLTPDDAQLSVASEKTKESSIKKNTPKQQGDNLPPKQSIDRYEKSNLPITENTRAKPVTAENISSKLTIHANDYVVGSFGGIRNLEVTLQNNSSYLLDKVTVTVDYLNPEGIIIKTENIYFQSVHAGEKVTVPVKKSKRGVNIGYKITKIESKDISSSTAAF